MKFKLSLALFLFLIAGVQSSLAIGNHFVKLNWVAPTVYQGGNTPLSTNVIYIVYKSCDGSHFVPVVADIALTNTQLIDSAVIPNQTYWYYVVSYDVKYSTRATSNTISVVVP